MKLLLKASHASAIVVLKYSSLYVKEELRTNTMPEVVSQIAILGPSKCLRAYCSNAILFFFNLHTLYKTFKTDLSVATVTCIYVFTGSVIMSSESLKAMV